MGVSVLTIVRNRSAHLDQLVEGLRRSELQPDELIIVDMSDTRVEPTRTAFPVHIDHFETDGIPLAAARNRAAALASHDNLVFLDVDCIPLAGCLGTLVSVLAEHDALLCADIRYLGPDDARGQWREEDLQRCGQHHPVRSFPSEGIREETNPGLFWSLAFAIRRSRFESLKGFDERFVGYGAEDTDFGFRSAEAGVKLMFVGQAIACHQHHITYDPPLQHLSDIIRNARLFHARWAQWPMEGWLAAFSEIGLVSWSGDKLELLREPTNDEIERARVTPVVALHRQTNGKAAISRMQNQGAEG